MSAPSPAPKTAVAVAREIVWAARGRLALGLAVLLVDRAAGFALPLAPKLLLDEVVGKRREELLPWLAALVLGAAAVQAACALALTRVLGLSAERVVLGWRRRLMDHVVRAKVAELSRVPSGSLVSRILDDAATMQNLVGAELVRWSTNVITAVAAFVALMVIDWQMTLVALALAAVPGLAIHLAYRRLLPLFRERGELRAAVTGRLTQTLAGVRVVKAFGAERREHLAFTRGMHALFRVTTAATSRRAAMHAAAIVATAAVVVVVLVMGGRSMLGGRLSLGDFGSYVAFALLFAAPLLDLPEIAARTSETLADLERLREVASLAREGDEAEGAGDADSARGRANAADSAGDVELRDVSFAYEPGRPVLHGVSFVAPAGKTTALVGPSGAGKSTLLALLLRFHEPTSGSVLVGGVDVRDVPLRAHRRRTAVVLQDDVLFDGTLADNVALGRPRASLDEIARALDDARCGDFLPSLEHGLATRIGERGVRLSGGQRQRVSIARAILADAPLLLLDEATSSLDGEREADVQRALARLRAGRTAVVIAHRLSTIRSADHIVVLDRGRVVEEGPHDALLAGGGLYARLWALSTEATAYDREPGTAVERPTPPAD